jgi:hypothetical protein
MVFGARIHRINRDGTMITAPPTSLIPADGQPITTVAQLNDVLVQAAQQTRGNYEIDLTPGAAIALTSALEAINLQSGVTLDIKGNGASIRRDACRRPNKTMACAMRSATRTGRSRTMFLSVDALLPFCTALLITFAAALILAYAEFYAVGLTESTVREDYWALR